jgi:hypothetical protein
MVNPERRTRNIADRINAIALAIHRGAITNLDTWSGPAEPRDPLLEQARALDPNQYDALPDPPTDDEAGNPIDYHDPTGNAAGTRPDIHAWARREIDRLLAQVENDLDETLGHLRMGLATRQAQEIKAKLPPACTSCARLRDHQHRTLYTPARVTRYIGKRRLQLCDWCDNFHTDYHQLPPITILRAYHDGRRPNRRTIERAIRNQRKTVRT